MQCCQSISIQTYSKQDKKNNNTKGHGEQEGLWNNKSCCGFISWWILQFAWREWTTNELFKDLAWLFKKNVILIQELRQKEWVSISDTIFHGKATTVSFSPLKHILWSLVVRVNTKGSMNGHARCTWNRGADTYWKTTVGDVQSDTGELWLVRRVWEAVPLTNQQTAWLYPSLLADL